MTALHLGQKNLAKNSRGDTMICSLLIKSREGLGLLVYAEEFYLRGGDWEDGKKSCEDYVEFGEEDVIPFITMKRSGRMCGKQAGESLYDDPGGQLLIWLGLGEVVPSDLPKLTLVITPYSKKPDHRNNQLKKCKRGNYWIRKKYFCDGRVNCPKDEDPQDEAAISCATTPAPPTTTSTTETVRFIDDNGIMISDDSWDYSAVSILLISIVGLLVIACGIVCTLKKCRLGPLPRTPDSWTPDCPETSFGMLQVTSGGARRAEDNTYVVQQPPLPRRPTDSSTASPNYAVVGDRPGSSSGSSTVTGHTTSIRMPKQSPLLNRRNMSEAPPPSYNEIFPPDYVPDASIMRGANNNADADNVTINPPSPTPDQTQSDTNV